MREELLINATPRETRVAVVENGVLHELMLERSNQKGLVGNIYRGRVIRVLPGMQSAFIDIGIEREAFLHVSELITKVKPESAEDTNSSNTTNGKNGKNGHDEDITKLLKPGHSLLVQVTKDPLGSKGARLTTNITLASRYLVLMPKNPHIGISQRIESPDEKQRLKDIITKLLVDRSQGFIVRTAAEGIDVKTIQFEIKFLQKLWEAIK